MQDAILNEISEEGLYARAVPASRLAGLKAEYEELHASGSIDEELYGELMQRYRFDAEEAPGAQTVLTVAMPSPVCTAVFHHEGRELAAMIPPTYRDYVKAPLQIERQMNVILGKYGYHASWARRLPEKLLAVRGGLAEYGRNNITYVKGLGSFVFLSSYFTDMPCEADTWGAARRMAACAKCSKCVGACPTGAIRADRNVILAGRCLTMHNEKDSAIPFPTWINPSAHNSLVGCFACQLACPMNSHRLGFKAEPVAFDEEETALLLQGAPFDSLPQALAAKAEALNLKMFYEGVARNLKALFKQWQKKMGGC